MARVRRPRPPDRDGLSPSLVVTPGAAPAHCRTLLDFLSLRFPGVTPRQWQRRFDTGLVCDDDGGALASVTPFSPGLRIHYFRAVDDEPTLPFEETVLFQDDHLVVADKPHFLPVVPGGRHVHETLLGRLKRRLGIDTLVPLHRIDRDTAGLVLFSVRPDERDQYQRLFRERRVDKCYEALAPLRPGLSFPLLRRSRLVESAAFMQMQEVDGPVNAETCIELAEPNSAIADGVPVLFRLRPKTGQKHQLRAHMAALGIPIVNDRIYPSLLPAQDDAEVFDRPLQLIARSLAFDDPLTGERRRFTSRRMLAATPGG